MIGVYSAWKGIPVEQESQSNFLAMAELSVRLAKKQFSELHLYCDKENKLLLAPILYLFDKIEDNLDSYLKDINSKIWSMGKLATYSLQTKPFLHIDWDFFIFTDKIKDIFDKSLVSQSSEKFHVKTGNWCYPAESFYSIFPCDDIIKPFLDRPVNFAVNMGVFGGNNLPCIREYSQYGINLIRNNSKAVENFTKNFSYFNITILLEQWAIGPFCAKHKDCMSYLTEENINFIPHSLSERVDFLHFGGGTKRTPQAYRFIKDTLSSVR